MKKKKGDWRRQKKYKKIEVNKNKKIKQKIKKITNKKNIKKTK
jgi:hypothetical protein